MSTACGVSFANKSLKLDTSNDAREIVEAIKSCERLEYLNMAGNTLGVDAAAAIAEVLQVKGYALKRACWRDMFTGRLKEEIPRALEYLGMGLRSANTRLVKLDLSDNALGPIGATGLAEILSSNTCYTLQELSLNNNGLGVSGGKILAQALLDCYENSVKTGVRPMSLKIFIAGRNRLENEGAIALAAVFEKLTSLEEIVMPQNGIYHAGIVALIHGISFNSKLKVLNFNDNLLGSKGAKALANTLHKFPNIEELDLGDCMLKTEGCLSIVKALGIKNKHPALRILNLGFNEICAPAVFQIAKAMADKTHLAKLTLDGNVFGANGQIILRDRLAASNQIHALKCDDSSSDDDDNNDEHDEKIENIEIANESSLIENFFKAPSDEKLLLIPDDDVLLFVAYIENSPDGKKRPMREYVEAFVHAVMVISALCESGNNDVRAKAEKLTDVLYRELFCYAARHSIIPILNNALLVSLGLLKSEDKRLSPRYNLKGCFKALEIISRKEYFSNETKDNLRTFLENPIVSARTKPVDPLSPSKASLKSCLSKIL